MTLGSNLIFPSGVMHDNWTAEFKLEGNKQEESKGLSKNKTMGQRGMEKERGSF